MTSVIVCFYERWKHLKCCLDALQSCSRDFDEVIITDDGSTEDAVKRVTEIIRDYDFVIKYVWQPKKGFRAAAARNNGIRHARGDYLVFLDCDFLVFPDTIKCHLMAARLGRFVAAWYKYLNEEESSRVFNSPITADLLENLYGQIPDRETIRAHRRFIKRTILFRLHLANRKKQSLGGHFSIYRQDIERVNGYDENFVGWGGEDEDLGIRLVRAGIYGRSVIGRARALHVWHPTELGDRHWKKGSNVDYFMRRYIPYYCKNGLRKA